MLAAPSCYLDTSFLICYPLRACLHIILASPIRAAARSCEKPSPAPERPRPPWSAPARLSAEAGEGGQDSKAARTRAAATVAPIRVPAEFAAATAAPPVTFEFPMTGAQVFARACKEEGVAALFACPGNYPVIHALAAAGIPAYGGRHEGSMAHAADAFIRVTGEIAVSSGTEGPGFTDMICAIACANAARTPLLVVASNMSIAHGRHRGRHPARLSAADDGRAEEVRQAVDHPAPRPRIRRLRVPAAEERRARTGAPRLPGRGRVRALQGRHRARVLPRQVALSHRLAAASVAERHRQGRRADQDRAAPDHRVEQRRVLREGVGCAEARRREGADPGRRVRRHEGPVLGRQPAVGQRRARRARQRRPGDPGRPALHADRGRVRVRAGREVHPHRPGARRHRPQPADRSRHRQLRAGGARGARRCGAGDDA